MRKALLILCLGLFLTGCMRLLRDMSEQVEPEQVKPESLNSVTTEPTKYTFEDLDAMAVPGKEIKHFDKENSFTDTALENYNILLGHVESVLGKDYYITNYGWDDIRGGDTYFVWIVMKEWADAYKNGEEVAVYLGRRFMPEDSYSKYKGQYIVQSGLETFMMARKYTADLRKDFYEIYPDYHINTFYLSIDNIWPEPAFELFDKSDDYEYYYNSSYKRDCTNTVNILLPPDTTEDEIDKIYGEMKEFLKEHRVTTVYYCVLIDGAAKERVLAEEEETDNFYSYDKENFSHGKSFKISED